MKKLFTILCLVLSISLFSQENNANIWYFGENAGVDFTTGIPQGITNGELNTWEGCASICNQQGELMFYTDGQNIYNSNHQIMPNGDGLLGDYSASQSSIIIPKPDLSPDNNIYYVFTVDKWQDDFVNGLRYSIVDMNLNGGFGDVTSEKNILLHDRVAEKITAIHHTNNQDVWILTHDWGSNDYLAHKLTADSIFTTPIVSSYGYNYSGDYSLGAGQLRFSKNGNYFVSTMTYIHRFELFKFNKTTGELYDMLEFQDDNFLLRAWGAEFSRDERLLYIAKRPPEILLQFDLENWDYDSVINSAYAVETTSGSTEDYDAGTLQMGPNGKIYLTRYDQTYISVVNNPNNIGNSCDFEEIGVDLNDRLCKWGLPNLFYFKEFQFFTGSEIDTIICEGDSIYLENTYQTIAGTYYDTTQTNQGWDSIINIHLAVLPVAATPIITEDSGVLSSSSATYNQWYFNGTLITGATNQQYEPFEIGTYQVVVDNNNGCLSFSDSYSFNLEVVNEMDTTICEGDSIYLENAYQTIAGTFYDTLQTNQGVDSIINIHLAVLPVAATPIITEDSGVLSSSSSTSNQWYFNGVLITGATNQQYQPFVSGTYQVVVENNNACLSFSDEYQYLYVGIQEQSKDVKIFPNPFSEYIFINNDDLFSIEVYDLKGTKLFSKEKLKGLNKIDLMHLDKGFYILKVKTRNKLLIRKITNK